MIKFNFEYIPNLLKKHNNWVVWRLELKKGAKPTDHKPYTKVPYCPAHPRRKASTKDPRTWGSYEEAKRCYEQSLSGPDSFDGIGFVFTKQEEFFGFDVDHCLDAHQMPNTQAKELLQRFPTYTEISPSGDGLRFLFVGRCTINKTHGNFQVFSTKGYLTITGHHYAGTPTDMRTAPDFESWHHAVYPEEEEKPPP